MMSELSKRMSEGIDFENCSPDVILELISIKSEWTNIQDIIKLTLKAFYQVVKMHDDKIFEIEQVLPQKANKNDISHQMAQKANLIDMKKTMAEVAANIESRTTYEDIKRMLEDKITKPEMMFQLQNKVSFEDMKHYIDQTLNHQSHSDAVEEELARIKQKMEETYRDMQKKMSQGIVGSKDIQQLSISIDTKFNEIEQAIDQKANKQSVAQALHRKANRPDIDTVLAKKADLSDLQRVIAALENKIDITSFEGLVRAVESKADRHEVSQQPSSFRASTEVDKALQKFNNDKFDMEKRLNDIERSVQVTQRDAISQVDQIKSLVNMNLTQKVDYRDIDNINHQIHNKADIEKVQELVTSLRNEVVAQLTQIKKDVKQKTKAKDDDSKKKKKETEFANEKAFEEIKTIKEKMQKLAAQFDKELTERDKQMKNIQQSNQGDIQKVFGNMQLEIENIRKIIADIEQRKGEKRELNDFKQKVVQQIELKSDQSDVSNQISKFTAEQTQKQFDLRQELFKKVTEIQNLIQMNITKKVGMEEFNEALSQKVDLTMLRSSLDQKIGFSEYDGMKKLLDRIIKDIEGKSSFKDLEAHVNFCKNVFEDLTKELLLKANIKDLIPLLDTKANVEDVNGTLSLVQREVEKCITEDEMRKTLNEQALINEALCAQNCVGRWIWKSGEIKPNSLVPWEVQALNTCPDNFLWEKSKTSIVAVAPGLYEVSFGFYSKKQPTVQIHLNGEPLMSVSKSSQAQIRCNIIFRFVNDHGKENRISNVGKHSAGNVTGLTLLDFIALPARARLSLTFTCDSPGEGFFNIRKL
ncbi:UNKNOWN [Stylonychia lemnae]|uniref:C1q domain-containing protein n=1 Tax=Stylonychia lemnae TaxID=5949 RepID=A0A078AG74_STYLE|nr:UNKNOWN [Stylonychia lemnae]|eukprot:CDW81229.1 UNKNOWN [Stylonychia lemnae]